MVTGVWLWSWVLTVVGITGLYLAGSKRKLGWAVGIAAQGLWVAYAVHTRQWGFLASAGAYGWVYARNLWKWHREDRPEVVAPMNGGTWVADADSEAGRHLARVPGALLRTRRPGDYQALSEADELALRNYTEWQRRAAREVAAAMACPCGLSSCPGGQVPGSVPLLLRPPPWWITPEEMEKIKAAILSAPGAALGCVCGNPACRESLEDGPSCAMFDAGYPWCRVCGEHHRPPNCRQEGL